jgi:DNA-directed RNA polymerase specialized sigma subunit
MCVERLSEQDRELLRIRFEPGATNRSVSAAVGRPERTVSRILSQLYGNLLECIQRRNAAQKQGERS